MVSLLALGAALYLSSPVAAAESTPITGNLTLSSDYVFRGISQTQGHMAVQGGLTYNFPSGVHLGIWASNISGDLYTGGNSEWDFSAGYSHEIHQGLSYDFGVLRYAYPGAASAGPASVDFDTTEAYLGLTSGHWGLKYSRALSDWFGVSSRFPCNKAGTPAGSSEGTQYFEASWTFEARTDLSIKLHAGHTSVSHYSDASYADYGVVLAKKVQEFEVDLSFSTNDVCDRLYTVNGENNGASRVILSVGRSF